MTVGTVPEAELPERELIYDWNTVLPTSWPTRVELMDQTLRDGLQTATAHEPPLEDKFALLHRMEALGIDAANIGFPAAGPRTLSEVQKMAREIAVHRLRIRPACLARARREDIERVADVAQGSGLPVEVGLFLHTSPIHQYVHGWTEDRLLAMTEENVGLAVRLGLPVTFVSEDAARSHPRTLARVFQTALGAGASRLCLCDTAGHATPKGAARLVSFTRELVRRARADVRVDWYGLDDRGLAVPNALAALKAGADRLHATALGMGERVGNTPMDLLLVNLKLLGALDRSLEGLRDYCELAARAFQVTVLPNYPVLGADAFRTGTGVHAAAIVKAERKGHAWLADRIYSGVPAGMFGFRQILEIGPMAGESNAVYWLVAQGLEPTRERLDRIMAAAKTSDRILTDDEVRAVLGG